MKRPAQPGENGVVPTVLRDPAFEKRCPTLFQYLTDGAWEDGTERETSTLLLMADGGSFKAWLNDRAMGRSLWVAGPSLQGLLDAVETALLDPCAVWKTYTPGGPQQKRKK